MSKLFADELSQAADLSSGSRRQAALLLHAMGEPDRAWALGKLSPDERLCLAPLLAELRDLGVAADASCIRDVLGEPAAARSGPTERQRIASADPALVAQILMREPVALVHRVLNLGPWPWSSAVLAILRTHRGQAFVAMEPLAQEAGGQALEWALLSTMANKLALLHGLSTPKARPDVPGRLRGWWRAARKGLE